jgi:predicted transcriptional regulator
MSANDVRKNFVFKKEVAEHLEEIARKERKSMTKVLEDMIEKKYLEVSKEDKLKALYAFAGSGTGLFGDLTIQDIKANMDV